MFLLGYLKNICKGIFKDIHKIKKYRNIYDIICKDIYEGICKDMCVRVAIILFG